MTAVRPNEHNAERVLAPIGGGFGDCGNEAHDGPNDEIGAGNNWEELADKYDQLEKQVKEYLDDNQDN